MRLSTKGRFAVTAMIDLALNQRSGPVPLSAIAQRQQISLSYLEQMFSKLRQQGLVESTRGPGGGYMLGQRGDEVTVADIIIAIEGGGGAASETAGADELIANREMTQALWDALSARLLDAMRSICLKTLVAEQAAKGVATAVRKPLRQGVLRKPKPEALRSNAPNSIFALGAHLATKS